jgi:plasmid stabilization system protein ParE
MREVIWLAGADADLQAIFDLLEDRQPGRGVRFMDEINAELAWLREYPKAGSEPRRSRR